MSRNDARTALLDAAERLFAVEGIATVSDRRIAEAAGNTNHSAVRYYFGGRVGLLEALLDRHLQALEEPRAALFAQATTLLDDIRALILPLTASYAALPAPSWRARFFNHAQHDPSTVELLRERAAKTPSAGAAVASITERLAHLDRGTVEGRARLMVHVVVVACADVEERAEREDEPADWDGVGRFLSDAIAGMLQAPVTPA